MVSKDVYGTQTYLEKTIPLEAGDNICYLFVMKDEEIVNKYTITIRRKPIYNVTFNDVQEFLENSFKNSCKLYKDEHPSAWK